MASKAMGYSILVFRILTLLSLGASIAVMVTNSFTDVITYETHKLETEWILRTYVFVAGVFVSAYTLVQLPFAFYFARTEKRLIRNEYLPEFDFYADKVMSFFLATAVGAGFAVSFEFKKILTDFVVTLVSLVGVDEADEFKSQTVTFLNRGIIATALLAFGFLCMAALSIFSSIIRTSTKGFWG